MTFNSDVDHVGYTVSSHRFGRWVERRGGLAVRTSFTDGIPYVSLRWERPAWGFVWRLTNRCPWFHYEIKRRDTAWEQEAVEVDTWPRRR